MKAIGVQAANRGPDCFRASEDKGWWRDNGRSDQIAFARSTGPVRMAWSFGSPSAAAFSFPEGCLHRMPPACGETEFNAHESHERGQGRRKPLLPVVKHQHRNLDRRQILLRHRARLLVIDHAGRQHQPRNVALHMDGRRRGRWCWGLCVRRRGRPGRECPGRAHAAGA